jgi:hypothetical protein
VSTPSAIPAEELARKSPLLAGFSARRFDEQRNLTQPTPTP